MDSLAKAERSAKDRRLQALAETVAAFEVEFGQITAEEITAQGRADRAAALVIRAAVNRRTDAGKPR